MGKKLSELDRILLRGIEHLVKEAESLLSIFILSNEGSPGDRLGPEDIVENFVHQYDCIFVDAAKLHGIARDSGYGKASAALLLIADIPEAGLLHRGGLPSCLDYEKFKRYSDFQAQIAALARLCDNKELLREAYREILETADHDCVSEADIAKTKAEMTPKEMQVYKALEGFMLCAEEISDMTGIRLATVKACLRKKRRLQKSGLVTSCGNLGYYRPDALPIDRTKTKP